MSTHLYPGIKASLPQLVATLVIAISIFLGLLLIRSPQHPTPKAADTVQFSISSSSTLSSPDQATIKIYVDPNSLPITFVRAELSFDPTLLQLTSEVSAPFEVHPDPPISSPLRTIIQRTSMTDANLTGRIVFVAGLSPMDLDNPPSSPFELASFTITPTSTLFSQTQIAFTGKQEVVDKNLNQPAIAAQNLNLTLNPVPTPTSTPTLKPTNTPPPTPRPIKPGDANGDGIVDGRDYIIWLKHYNQTTTAGPSTGDFNNDNLVDGRDYIIWLVNYYS